MTIPRLKEMTAYWESNPPIHLMIASYFDVGNKPKEAESEQGGIEELLASIPQVPR